MIPAEFGSRPPTEASISTLFHDLDGHQAPTSLPNGASISLSRVIGSNWLHDADWVDEPIATTSLITAAPATPIVPGPSRRDSAPFHRDRFSGGRLAGLINGCREITFLATGATELALRLEQRLRRGGRSRR